MQLLFGKMNNYLCIGIRIEDMPDTPALISGPQVDLEEHKVLMQSIKQKKIPYFSFQ